MSTWTSLFDVPLLALVWAFTFAMAGGPLLWRFLNYRPVTRCAVLLAASNVVESGCGLTFGSAVMNAYGRGLISMSMTILAIALLLAGLAGGSFLIARCCPDEQS